MNQRNHPPLRVDTSDQDHGRVEKVEKALKAVLDPAKATGACTGYELVDVQYTGHKQYIIKLGVYPWGVTFLQGAVEESIEQVRSILRDIQRHRVHCPVCGTLQPLVVEEWMPWHCAWGVAFFPTPHKSMMIQHLLSHVDDGSRSIIQHRLDDGWELSDLFAGVDAVDNHEILVYRMLPNAEVLPDHRLSWGILVTEALIALGFTPDDAERLTFSGTLADMETIIRIGVFSGEDPLIVMWPDSTHLLCGGITQDTVEERNACAVRLDRWEEFVYGPHAIGRAPWVIRDWTSDEGETVWVAAFCEDTSVLRADTVDATIARLFQVLPTAVSVAQDAVQDFLHRERGL